MIKTKSTIILFGVFTILVFNINAQDAILSTGGDASGLLGSASYSVGQVVYTSNTGSAGSSSQGVQQAYIITVVGVDSIPHITVKWSVSPNPSSSYFNLNIGIPDLENISYRLYDVLGQILKEEKITSTETLIYIADFASGHYYLKVIDDNSDLKTFKIIKN